jgi:prepilin-type N-terminal cleavage/methylation domain-containing protein
MRATRADRPANKAAGFTLVELMAVMFILAVIVSLVVGVGMYIVNKAREKETQGNQAIIMDALADYQGRHGVYPDTLSALTTDVKCQEILRNLTASAGASFSDGFGKAMLYAKEGGLGGKPVLISGGPDLETGLTESGGKLTVTAGSETKVKDNIRSDGG